ncbi:MAG: hypothetical protein ACM32I_04840, partial [Nitrospirota bacterium]
MSGQVNDRKRFAHRFTPVVLPRRSPPACHHASTPHHRESHINALAGIVSADADEIANPAKSPIPAGERAQPVALHNLIAIKMSPV